MSRNKKKITFYTPVNWYDQKSYLITGMTGSIGAEFQFDMILAYPIRHVILIIFSLKYCLKNEQKSIIR